MADLDGVAVHRASQPDVAIQSSDEDLGDRLLRSRRGWSTVPSVGWQRRRRQTKFSGVTGLHRCERTDHLGARRWCCGVARYVPISLRHPFLKPATGFSLARALHTTDVLTVHPHRGLGGSFTGDSRRRWSEAWGRGTLLGAGGGIRQCLSDRSPWGPAFIYSLFLA